MRRFFVLTLVGFAVVLWLLVCKTENETQDNSS
jgi:hypothetical protein